MWWEMGEVGEIKGGNYLNSIERLEEMGRGGVVWLGD